MVVREESITFTIITKAMQLASIRTVSIYWGVHKQKRAKINQKGKQMMKYKAPLQKQAVFHKKQKICRHGSISMSPTRRKNARKGNQTKIPKIITKFL